MLRILVEMQAYHADNNINQVHIKWNSCAWSCIMMSPHFDYNIVFLNPHLFILLGVIKRVKVTLKRWIKNFFFLFFAVTTTPSPGSGHARRCNDTEKAYCVNGGDCYFIHGINQLSCKWVTSFVFGFISKNDILIVDLLCPFMRAPFMTFLLL